MNSFIRLPRIISKVRPLVARQQQQSSRSLVTRSRRVSSGHGGHGHGHSQPAGPYDPPHHATVTDKAFLFGIDPAHKTASEGWETITALTYLLTAGVFITIFLTRDTEAFSTWARAEALARERILANGGEVEFGKYYSGHTFSETELDKVPKNDYVA
eukprot:gene8665-9550_t